MRTMKVWIVMGLMGLLLLSQGCSRLIGEGAEVAMGPKGGYFEEKPVAAVKDHQGLEQYKRFELGEVKYSVGKSMPSDFRIAFPKKFNELFGKSRLPSDPSGKTLVFRVEVIHYETADLADNVFGPFEEVVARVELVDKETGKVIAQGTAVGRTGQSVGLGPDSKAEGLVKGLIKWASDYYPKPKKE